MTRPYILFVEDDDGVLDLGIQVLRDAGYDVVPAVSGDIAEVLLEQGLPFEVLITDIVMPGHLDGFALARRARELRPDIRIIYATGFSGSASVRTSDSPDGAKLIKPWQPDELVRAVNACCPLPPKIDSAPLLSSARP